MQKKQFIKSVINKVPEFSYFDGGYFYVHPVQHILSGFICEIKSSSATIWQYTFPLFDQKDFLHLTYSSHSLDWPNYNIEYESLAEKDLSDVFVDKIQPLIPKAYEALSLKGFIDFLQQGDTQKTRIPPSRRVAVGYAYIMLGEVKQALYFLELALEDDLVKLDSNIYNDCLNMLAFVKNNKMSNAQEILALRERKTKDWLKI